MQQSKPTTGTTDPHGMGGADIGLKDWFFGLYKEVLRGSDGNPYLTRWHILHFPGFRILLHKIWKSDESQCPHDHPWNFLSIMLWGWYEESQYDSTGNFLRKRLFVAPNILYRKAPWIHRLDLKPGKSTWTLVITSGKKRSWGFWSYGENDSSPLASGPRRFIPWRNFKRGGSHKC